MEQKTFKEPLITLSQAIKNNLLEGLMVISNDGLILSVNPTASHIFESSSAEMVGKMFADYLWDARSELIGTPPIGSHPEAYFEQYLGESQQEGRTATGTRIRLHCKIVKSKEKQKGGFLVFLQPLTNGDHLKTDVELSYIRLKELVKNMNAAVIIQDGEQKIVLANQYFCNLFSIPLTPDELTGYYFTVDNPETASFFAFPDNVALQMQKLATANIRETDITLSLSDGTEILLDFIPVQIDGDQLGYVWIYRNIYGVSKNQQQLKRQSTLLSSVASAANILITSNHTNFDIAIDRALERVGIASGKDRINIYEVKNFREEPPYEAVIRYEWAKDSIDLSTHILKKRTVLLDESLSELFNELVESRYISIQIEQMPESLQAMLKQQEVKYVLYFPIIIAETFWGIIAMHSVEHLVKLTPEEERILLSFASSIGGAIASFSSSKALTDKNTVLSNLNFNLEESILEAQKQSHEAMQAANAKTQFLAQMSHEIRTPMNGVIGMTSLLQRTKLNEEQRECLSSIRNSGDALITIINDILDFSKIESGAMELELNPFDIRLCIEDVLDLFWLTTAQKKLDVSYTVSPDIRRRLVGDVSRIRQILVNLVGNAVKFTDSGSIRIAVSLIESGRIGEMTTVEFKVVDTGIGIPTDKQDRLFKAFNQVDASISRRYGGTGLGLAISSRLVDLMGGTIGVTSEHGLGSTFTFTLPLEQTGVADITAIGSKFANISIFPHIHDEQSRASICNFLEALGVSSSSKSWDKSLVITDNPTYDMEGVRTIFINSTHAQINEKQFCAQLYLPLKISNVVNTLKKVLLSNNIESFDAEIEDSKSHLFERYPINILVAEDNTINQKLMRKSLSYYGYTPDIVANGLEVLEALERQPYDLIFMDIQMPEMDGLEATRAIVKKYQDARPRIVAMTASALGADRDSCLAVGMDDYTSKPIKIEVIEKMIIKWNPNAKKFIS